MAKNIKVSLRKGMIGRPEKHRRVLRALGLRRIDQSVIVQDVPTIRGMVEKVKHLVDVEGYGNEAA
ncbi:MAG: 50S ribosomal protein L30 [Pseudomonadota bacterium]